MPIPGMGPTLMELVAVILAVFSLWLMLIAQKFPPSLHEVILFLPPYGVVSLGCYALGMLGYGVMAFPTCPQEGKLLQKDIAEARAYLEKASIK